MKLWPRGCFLALCLLRLGSAIPAAAATESEEFGETSRLVTAAKIWATVKFFHPDSLGPEAAWDKAVAAALPKIRAADSLTSFQSAVNDLLRALKDPETFVLTVNKNTDDLPISVEHGSDGVLVIAEREHGTSALSELELLQSIQSSPRIVFDLRGSPVRECHLAELLDRPEFSGQLTRVTVSASEMRKRVYNGWTPEKSRPESRFHSAYYSWAGPQISPDANSSEHNIVFLVNEHGALPVVASTLWENGRASVLVDSMNFRRGSTHSASVPLGATAAAYIRISDTAVRFSPVFVSPSEAMQKAMALLQRPASDSPPYDRTWPRSSPVQLDKTDRQPPYPDEACRILAAFKTWAVVHHFFAYRDLMDEDWDDRLAEFLPKFIQAKDAREYNLAISEEIVHLADSQAAVQSDALAEYFGRAPVGLRLRLIEKRPMITEILDAEARAAGVQVGDIVSQVDGENIIERIKREAGIIAASTQQSLSELVTRYILYGPEGSLASLSIGGQDGKTREIHLKRSAGYESALEKQRTGEIWKRLSSDIGYIDLDRLRNQDVETALAQLDRTKPLILDARGTANDSAFRLAARLSSRGEATAATLITTPLVLAPDFSQGDIATRSASSFFVRSVPGTENSGSSARLVVLIDGRTVSLSEQAGLFFEAGNKAEFVGSPSAGALGETSNFVLPGGVTVSFSGQDIRHANGGQLQRLGFQPNVTISPTVSGIRKGRDEVLEKAIEYLSK